MRNKQVYVNDICRGCGCSKFEATADAQTLGLEEGFRSGTYTCCQIVGWADEQWLAWVEAAIEDGKPVDEVTKPLEIV
jgi:hypothetical protein